MTISKRQAAHILIGITLLVSLSLLRMSLVLIYPVLAWVLGYLLGLKLDAKSALFACLFVLAGLVSGYLAGGYLTNFLVSLYLIMPAWLFLRAQPQPMRSFSTTSFFEKTLERFAWILFVINISALIYSQLIVNTGYSNYEDAFTGLYGQGGFGSHTLSVVNLGLSVYFLNRKAYLNFGLFLIFGIMGFYGLGLMVFIGSLILLYASSILRYWKVLIILALSAAAGLYFISVFNARNLDYIKKNIDQTLLVFESYDYHEEIEKSEAMKITEIPRFITFLDGARQRFFGDPKVFLLGVAPGGYNSRTAFYLNGNFVQNEFLLRNFQIQTREHAEDIFPLLNRELIQRPFNDGTRNQTFSSIVSVLLEYGVLAGGGFLILFFGRIYGISRLEQGKERKNYLRFLGIYFLALFSVQNYLEYPEVLFLFVLLIKLAEVDAVNTPKKESHAE